MPTLPTIVKFTDNELHRNCFSSFEMLRRQGKLCDVTLLADSHRYAAHKIVLAATIPFFNAMFLSNMSESTKSEIFLLGLTHCAVEAFIGFAYTGSIQITPNNVQNLLMGATYLQVNTIRDVCCKYVEDRLSPSIVLTVRSLAQMLHCSNLVTACNSYIQENFEAVALTDSFLLLDADELMTFLESDELAINSEEALFSIVMRWVEYDRTANSDHALFDSDHDGDVVYHDDSIKSLLVKSCATDTKHTVKELESQSTNFTSSLTARVIECQEEAILSSSEPCIPQINVSCNQGKAIYRKPCAARLTMLPNLLRCIRLPLVPAKFISNVISKHALIRENIQCRDLLDEVRDLLLLRTSLPCSFCCRPRRGQEVFGVIYAVGGLTETGDCHGIVETYHPSIGRWELAEHMPSNRSRVGIVVLNGLLYAIGGFDGSTRLKTTEFYNPQTKSWHSAAPMNHKRSALGAAALDGRVYVCGGYDGTSSLRTCEVYNPEQDKWHLIPSMTEPRSACGLVALDNGCLYAVGGHNGLMIYSSVECYNRRACSGFGTFVRTTPAGYSHPDTSVAAGVCPTTTSVNSISPGQRSQLSASTAWHPVARMRYRRCRHGLTVCRNRIIVAGGYNGVTFLLSVEIFDPASGPLGQWTEIAPMKVPRSRVGLAFTGGLLYAIGGFDGVTHLRTVEILQPPPPPAPLSSTSASSSSSSSADEVTLVTAAEASRRRALHLASPERFLRPLAATAAGQPGCPAAFSCPQVSDDESGDDGEVVVEARRGRRSGGTLRPCLATSTSSSGDFGPVVTHSTGRPAKKKPSGDQTAMANWRWTDGSSMIAHEGWVGVAVLPLAGDASFPKVTTA